jgi:hypothetical protein
MKNDKYNGEAEECRKVYDAYLNKGFTTDQSFQLLLKFLDAAVATRCYIDQEKPTKKKK